MKQLVNVNLTTKTADWTPPELFFGETLTLALRFFRNTDGEESETAITVDSFSALIGDVDKPPRGGTFALRVGPGPATESNTTASVPAAATAGEMRSALAALTNSYGTPRVVAVDGSWLIFFGDQTVQVPLEVVNNGLWPISYGRITAWQVDGKWVHELRLLQTPVAATSSHDVVLPPAPTVARLQEGGTDPSGTFFWNEIQELQVPIDFRGAYILKKGFAKTTLLSREDGIAEIEEALGALGNSFKVTLPLSQRPAIEFIGDFAGLPQDLLEVEVKQAPPGDVTFSLVLDRAELGAALRVQEAVTLPMEIRVTGEDAGGFEGQLVALSLPVVIRRPVTWPVLETRPIIDWLRPFSPRSYVPFGANNFLTGNKFYSVTVGDDEAVEFVVTHGLETEMVHVFVRENISGGLLLVHGVDYSVAVDDADQVTVTALVAAPDVDAWRITVVGAATIAEWANGLTVTVPQVIAGSGYPALAAFMDDIAERVGILEDLIVPGVVAAAPTSAAVGMEIVIPEVTEVLHYRGETPEFGKEGLTGLPARAPWMLPAVHAASVTTLPGTLPDPTTVGGTVYENEGSAEVELDGDGGLRGTLVAPDGFAASDGRLLYAVNRWGSTKSYYPANFERTLFAFAINDQMLAINRRLECMFGIEAQLVGATCKAQWVLSIELGTFSAEDEPATLGLNLENVVWGSPVVEQAIILTRLPQTHFFGVRVQRKAAEFLLDGQKYGIWTPNNDAAPASANFAVRARLTRFDTENRENPRGWVGYRIIGSREVKEDGAADTKPAKAVIS